jgi:hypothetical protein
MWQRSYTDYQCTGAIHILSVSGFVGYFILLCFFYQTHQVLESLSCYLIFSLAVWHYRFVAKYSAIGNHVSLSAFAAFFKPPFIILLASVNFLYFIG